MRNLKKFTVSLLTVATLITAFPFTAKAEDGEPIGSFLKDRNSITVENVEAEELFLDFLEEVSFIATDESWTNILEIKGKTGLPEKGYDSAVPDNETKISYADLSDFDCMIYNYTYCVFAILKNESGNRWETYTKDRDALTYLYQDFLNFKPTEGNNREAVNAAFEKIWDWQFEYIQEHDEPFDFVDQLTYSEMFPNSERESGDIDSPTQDRKEIESALEELDKSDKEEIQQAIEEATAENNGKSDKSNMGIVLPVVVVLAAVILVTAFIFMKKGKTQKK